MGCDIHTLAQHKTEAGWEDIDFAPFDWRDYGLFAFLAGVRNYSAVTPISEPRGLPDDMPTPSDDDWDRWCDLHSTSWLTVEELLTFNYDEVVEDRRYIRKEPSGMLNGAATCEPGQGKFQTWREFLGNTYFEDLEKLKVLGADRIVFGFDS